MPDFYETFFQPYTSYVRYYMYTYIIKFGIKGTTGGSYSRYDNEYAKIDVGFLENSAARASIRSY